MRVVDIQLLQITHV